MRELWLSCDVLGYDLNKEEPKLTFSEYFKAYVWESDDAIFTCLEPRVVIRHFGISIPPGACKKVKINIEEV